MARVVLTDVIRIIVLQTAVPARDLRVRVKDVLSVTDPVRTATEDPVTEEI